MLHGRRPGPGGSGRGTKTRSGDGTKRTATIPRRAGFLLPAAAILGVIILGLSGIYYFAAQTQNVRGHRFKGTLVAKYMTQGAVAYVRHLVRDAAHPGHAAPGDVDGSRSFRDLVRTPASQMEKALARARSRAGRSEQGDDRALLDRLFGKRTSEAIDVLQDTVRGASLRIYLDVEATPFPAAPSWYVDEVAKGVSVKIRAEADYGGVRRKFDDIETVVVYPLGPPVLGRFTGNVGYQWHESGEPFPSDPFDETRPDQPLLASSGGDLTAGKLAEAYQDRGWVYPRHQVVEPGGGVVGQHYLLWKPVGGAMPVPRSLLFHDPPPEFEQAIPHPILPGVHQRALLEGLVQGASGSPGDRVPVAPDVFPGRPLVASYYRDSPDVYPDVDPAYGGPGPFGTTLDPSPTFAPGSRATLHAITAVTLDRDESGSDESAQRAATGQDLPFRESFVYLVPHAPESPGDYLPDRMPTLSGGGVVQLSNRNYQADLDGDGTPDMTVSSEIPHPVIPVHAEAVAGARLFPEASHLAGASSRVVELPLNIAHELSLLDVEAAQERLHELAWDPSALRAAEVWEELPYGLEHRDVLHNTAREPAQRLHYGVVADDAKAAGDTPGLLRDLGEIEAFSGLRWMPTVYVYGVEALERFYPDGDLRGQRVVVMQTKKDGAATLRLNKAYHSGMLASGLIEVAAELPERGPDQLLELVGPFVVIGAFGEPHAQVYTANDGLFSVSRKAGDAAKLRGAAFVATDAPVSHFPTGNPVALAAAVVEARGRYQPAPLLVTWDAARDPVGPEAHRQYRVAWTGLR